MTKRRPSGTSNYLFIPNFFFFMHCLGAALVLGSQNRGVVGVGRDLSDPLIPPAVPPPPQVALSPIFGF